MSGVSRCPEVDNWDESANMFKVPTQHMAIYFLLCGMESDQVGWLTRRRHDTTRHDTTRRDATRRDTTRHDTTRHDATRHDATRRDATRRDDGMIETRRRIIQNSKFGRSPRPNVEF